MPREFADAKRLKISLREERYWEGRGGTGKQHQPGQYPRGFTDAERPENLCQRMEKGTGRADAELKWREKIGCAELRDFVT